MAPLAGVTGVEVPGLTWKDMKSVKDVIEVRHLLKTIVF